MPYNYEFKQTILEVAGVTFAYGDQKVLNDLSFTVRNVVRPNETLPQGQVVALLGKSGIGKSTLLKIIGGQMIPQRGTVSMLVHPSDTDLTPAKEGNVGIVYQDYLFFEHLTVKQLFRMALKQAGVPKENHDAQIARVIEEFGLQGQEGKWRQELSGGQRQRVAIAQQLLLGRQILILDEPFSGLDYAAKMKVAAFIQKVSQLDEFRTILLITHDIESAIMICDSVYLLAKRPDGDGASVAHTYNLMEEGIAWRPNNHLSESFSRIVREIKDFFLRS
jgi:ABC-type nitrate/sulfonate/bicarbonate transport system ATPase subunit